MNSPALRSRLPPILLLTQLKQPRIRSQQQPHQRLRRGHARQQGTTVGRPRSTRGAPTIVSIQHIHTALPHTASVTSSTPPPPPQFDKKTVLLDKSINKEYLGGNEESVFVATKSVNIAALKIHASLHIGAVGFFRLFFRFFSASFCALQIFSQIFTEIFAQR